jgi:hypothetical protein
MEISLTKQLPAAALLPRPPTVLFIKHAVKYWPSTVHAGVYRSNWMLAPGCFVVHMFGLCATSFAVAYTGGK